MGNYEIFYVKPEWFRSFILGDVTPKLADLHQTHTKVKEVEASSLEEVFMLMQGDIWSPNGEACDLIETLGLAHTSMSVGDVIRHLDTYYVVRPVGFAVLS